MNQPAGLDIVSRPASALEPDVAFAAWCAAADALPTMIYTAAADGSVEFVNRRWREFTGHEPNVVLGLAWPSIVHADDLERVMKAWQLSLESGGDLAIELRLRKADGSYAWIVTGAAPLRDAAGSILRWYGTCTDIDEHRRAEEALAKQRALLADSERRFSVLAESLPVICWTADASGSIDWYNHRWYEFTGQSPEEAAGWGWQAAHHPDDFLEVMRRWPHSIATGEPFEMEYRLRRFDGVFQWFLTRIEPLLDGSGKIERWYGSNVNIDAQRRALEHTKRVAETLQDIFLPKELPERHGLRMDAVYLPAEGDALVGGDWYDAFELPDGRLGFSIGDVAGHGLQASIIVGKLRQAIFTLAFRLEDPADILRELDRILNYQEPDMMVTAIVGFVDSAHATITYANAGHPPPIVARTNARPAVSLPYGGTPLGIGLEMNLVTQRFAIGKDAVVALYTDGMIEFSRDVIAVEKRLRAAVALLVEDTNIARPARAIREIVFDDMPARDDAALLLMQFSVVDLAALRSDPATLEKTWRFHSSDPYSAHASRREIIAYLRRMAAEPDQLFAGELVVGEILANTVEHAPGLVEVHVDWRSENPVLTVRDTGPGLRYLNGELPRNVLDEDGRGIFLIKQLTQEASVRPSPGFGTELRAVLSIERKKEMLSAPVRLRDRR
jgi:PAS domain S-box-containing protein